MRCAFKESNQAYRGERECAGAGTWDWREGGDPAAGPRPLR